MIKSNSTIKNVQTLTLDNHRYNIYSLFLLNSNNIYRLTNFTLV